MDVHSGKAVIDGPKNYLSSAYRAVPIAITVEGANIMTRSLMIYGQGSIRCHPFIQDEIEAAQNEDRDQGLQDFDKVLFKHIGYTLKTMLKAVGRSWTFGPASSVFAGERSDSALLQADQAPVGSARADQRSGHGHHGRCA